MHSNSTPYDAAELIELLPVPGLGHITPLPPEVQKTSVFSAGIGASAAHPEIAQTLNNFLARLTPGQPLTCIVKHRDGTRDNLRLDHSFNESQVEWFKAGSALNLIKQVGER